MQKTMKKHYISRNWWWKWRCTVEPITKLTAVLKKKFHFTEIPISIFPRFKIYVQFAWDIKHDGFLCLISSCFLERNRFKISRCEKYAGRKRCEPIRRKPDIEKNLLSRCWKKRYILFHHENWNINSLTTYWKYK